MASNLRSLTKAKDRLQGLLDAVLNIGSELDLPMVLHRIVTTAMELVGAHYGALGVLHASGDHLEQFITAGLSEEERAALGDVDFPHGCGVLGLLIHRPEPLRVVDIPAHPASVGFPEGHPPMRTLLGVAISVRGEIYGDLYLSERRDGRPFDQDDEEVVRALAGAAGWRSRTRVCSGRCGTAPNSSSGCCFRRCRTSPRSRVPRSTGRRPSRPRWAGTGTTPSFCRTTPAPP